MACQCDKHKEELENPKTLYVHSPSPQSWIIIVVLQATSDKRVSTWMNVVRSSFRRWRNT